MVVLGLGKEIAKRKKKRKEDEVPTIEEQEENLGKLGIEPPTSPFIPKGTGDSNTGGDRDARKEDTIVIRDQETGKPSVITTADGRTIAANEREIRFLANRDAAIRATPTGAVEASDIAARGQRAGIAGQVGQTELGNIEQENISFEQATKSGLGATIPGIAGGAVGGALTGAAVGAAGGPAAPVTVPIAAIGGAIIGGVGTFIAGFRSNLKTQRKDIVKGDAITLLKAEQNLLKIVMNTNKGSEPTEMLEMFNEQMSLIDQNYARIQLETSDDLSKWLGEDGHKQLQKFQDFNSPGGAREFLVTTMQEAVLNPDPNKILIGFNNIPA